jgi:hypothetical protein
LLCPHHYALAITQGQKWWKNIGIKERRTLNDNEHKILASQWGEWACTEGAQLFPFGEGRAMLEFLDFWLFPMCSYQVFFLFSSNSKQNPNMFLKFPICSQ